MNKSESLKELATALSKAQMEIKNPPFDSKNPFFKSNYASLASVRDTVIPILAKHGLTVIQNVSSRENGVACSNMLIHQSGEWLETDPFEVPVTKHDAQGFGSACTYSRRFSLMALMAVVGDADDDGNAAVKDKGAPVLKHLPNDGAGDNLSSDKKNMIADLAVAIKDAFKVDDHTLADSHYKSLAEQDEKLYLWSLLDSTTRRKIKEFGKQKEAA